MSERDGKDVVRKNYALMQHFLHIAEPEKLNEEDYLENVYRLKWLLNFLIKNKFIGG